MKKSQNEAAWQKNPNEDLTIESSDYIPPKAYEILVKNHAVSVNPADWILQEQPFEGMKCPMILGNDVAGEIVEVGAAVSDFKVGDRVIGQAFGCWEGIPSRSGFQAFTLLDSHMATTIPANMPYQNAVVIPLGLSTAACGLFENDHLALNLPSINAVSTGETVLIWGGSSSVGCNAIQLAVAAGYDVCATTSPKNFNLVKQLGVSQVFDYKSKYIIDELTLNLKNKTMAGALSTVGDLNTCYLVMAQLNGRKFVSSTQPALGHEIEGVEGRMIFASTLKENGIGEAIYKGFLGQALSDGRFTPAPKPQVIGQGLAFIQKGLEIQKAGVSAKKIVINL
jgi:NADPH:quinone reductase-like Zn-dependent oxidoreductase